MSSEMVERVARAICGAAGDNPDRSAMDACDPNNDGRLCWEDWTNEARAAIAAMREPTAKMVDEPCRLTLAPEWQAQEVWETMIDQALKD